MNKFKQLGIIKNSWKANSLKQDLEAFHNRKTEFTQEEIDKANKWCESVKGISMITSRKSESIIYMTEERMETAVPFNCDVCNKQLYVMQKDYDERMKIGKSKGAIWCGKPSCDLAIQGDDLPIITEDGVMHYKGILLTLNDF